MFPIVNLVWLRYYWKKVFEERFFPFYGVLLYTDADRDLATYVRKYWLDLDRASAGSCLVFAIEKTPKIEARDWHRFLAGEKTPFDLGVQPEDGIPFEHTNAYEIADWLKVSLVKLPCLVLFKDLNSADVVAIELPHKGTVEEITSCFREVFDVTRTKTTIGQIAGAVRMKKLRKTVITAISSRPVGDILKDIIERYVVGRW